MLARVLLLDLLEEPQDRREVLRALHQRAVDDLEEIRAINVATGVPEGAVHAARYPRAALEYGVRTSEGAVAWLAELLAELVPVTGAEDGRTENR